MAAVLLASYVTVFVSELLGDRTLIALAAMATRTQRFALLAAGLIPAFMLKMAAAVLLGSFVTQLSPRLVAHASAAVLLITAVLLWRKGTRAATEAADERPWTSIAAAFGVIFCSEWADAGQLAAAALVARYDAPLVVWIAAVLAMVTKASFAVLLGVSIGSKLPVRALRYLSCGACVAMAIVALLGVG